MALSVESTLSAGLLSSCGVGHYFMDSTSRSFAKARSSEEENLAKTKSLRGISARACAAKTMTWELESAKGTTVHDASSIEASLSQTTWEAKETTK